jgi:hypothetical protein
LPLGVPMPVQGVESPHPESTARAILVFREARSDASLTETAQHDRLTRLTRVLITNRTTDIDLISSHTRSVQPHVFG